METKYIYTSTIPFEMDCVHNQVERTMTLSWLNGAVKLVVCWQTATAVVLVREVVKRRFNIENMKIGEFMRIEEQTAEAAAQLARFNLAEMLELRVQQEQERLRSLGLTP